MIDHPHHEGYIILCTLFDLFGRLEELIWGDLILLTSAMFLEDCFC